MSQHNILDHPMRLQALMGGMEPAENGLWLPRGVACGLRLSLDRTRSVPTDDQTAKTAIYWVPTGAQGDWCDAWNGRDWVPRRVPYDPDTANQRDVTLLDLGMPQVANATTYDVFAKHSQMIGRWDIVATAWNSTTARWSAAPAVPWLTADGLAMWHGRLVAPTHPRVGYASAAPRICPEWIYLGTFYPSAAGQCEDSAAKRFLWNMYHRRLRRLSATDGTDSWTYSTDAWQAANANTTDGTGRVAFVVGLSEDVVVARRIGVWSHSAAGAGRRGRVGIGLDSTTVVSGLFGSCVNDNNAAQTECSAHYSGYPGIGYHYLQSLERGDGTATHTWYGDNGAGVLVQAGLLAEVWA